MFDVRYHINPSMSDEPDSTIFDFSVRWQPRRKVVCHHRLMVDMAGAVA